MSTLSIAPSFEPSRPPRPSVSAAPVRLTRRGRIVATVLMLAAMLAVLTLLSGHSAASGDSGEAARTRSVVVEEGDTLWGLAAAVAAPGEIREVVHQIEKLNSLPGPALVEGQHLAVPVG